MGISFMFLLAVIVTVHFCPVQTTPFSGALPRTGKSQRYSLGNTQLHLGVKTCQSDQFSCGDERKTCLLISWRCDGEKDCLNGADEEGCEVKTCQSDQFSCGDERTTCLPTSWRCDGDTDCPNGADEEGCVSKGEDLPVTSKNQTQVDLGSTQVTHTANGSDAETHKVPPTNITINHILEKQYEVLTLEKTKLILEIQNLKLKKTKLKLELHKLGDKV